MSLYFVLEGLRLPFTGRAVELFSRVSDRFSQRLQREAFVGDKSLTRAIAAALRSNLFRRKVLESRQQF